MEGMYLHPQPPPTHFQLIYETQEMNIVSLETKLQSLIRLPVFL